MAKYSLVSVVDDDESVRESLPDLLRQFGFAAQAFSSAEAFLASEFVCQTNCLILDVALLGMSGPDLQRELARRRQDIPIVFITAQADGTVRRHVLAQGAVECLFKPFSETALLDALNTALRTEYRASQLSPPTPCIRRNAMSSARAIEVVTMPDATFTVFVVDDDVSVRESLELLIGTAGWQPETFASAQGFLSRRRATGPCCLVLDVTLPGLNGLELQRQLAERTDMPIIFITGDGDVPTSVQAMKAGAVEFLMKPFSDDVLLAAIRDALERSRAALRLASEVRILKNCYESLTPREREVMGLVVSGLLNKQVGGELGISEITVKAHRGQVMRKMKADSLPDLVTMAARLDGRSTRIR
jgi:FixJ family two-component response regulator